MKIKIVDENNEKIATRNWGIIPRIGEGIILDSIYRVTDLIWDYEVEDPEIHIIVQKEY